MSAIPQQHPVAIGTPSWLRPALPWLIAAFAVAVLPFIFSSGHDIQLMSQIGVMIVFALSYNVLLGNTGLLSFGHAVYLGLGGYMAMHALRLMNDGALALPIELLPLVGAVAGLFFGIVFGALSTRRAGTVFALISLGLMELVRSSTLMFTGFFGGEAGLYGDRQEVVSFFGIDYGPDLHAYYLVAVWGMLAALAMYLLRKTPLGWMANAVRDNAERAQFVGYNPQMVRFLQFCIAAFFAGLAGGLFVVVEEIITDETVGAVLSGKVLLSAYIGGIGFFAGPVLGAALVMYLENVLASVSEAWMLYFGLIFIVVVMFAPMGLMGVILTQYQAIRSGAWKGTVLVRLYGAVTLIVAVFGGICLIEMAYHVQRSWDPTMPMSLFGVTFVATNALPWVVAVAILLIGLGAFLFHARPLYRRATGPLAGGK